MLNCSSTEFVYVKKLTAQIPINGELSIELIFFFFLILKCIILEFFKFYEYTPKFRV